MIFLFWLFYGLLNWKSKRFFEGNGMVDWQQSFFGIDVKLNFSFPLCYFKHLKDIPPYVVLLDLWKLFHRA